MCHWLITKTEREIRDKLPSNEQVKKNSRASSLPAADDLRTFVSIHLVKDLTPSQQIVLRVKSSSVCAPTSI